MDTFVLTTSSTYEPNPKHMLVKVNDANVCCGFSCVARKYGTSKIAQQKLDYMAALLLIERQIGGTHYVILLEDDYEDCYPRSVVDHIIQNNARDVLVLSYGAVAIAYSRRAIPDVRRTLKKTDLPIDSALALHHPYAVTRLPLFVEHALRKGHFQHKSFPGICYQPCLDLAGFYFDREQCHLYDISPCKNTTSQVISRHRPGISDDKTHLCQKPCTMRSYNTFFGDESGLLYQDASRFNQIE